MKTVGGWRLALGDRKSKLFVFCLFTFAFCLSSCSIPSLESPECEAAREAVRQFYSFHYANDTLPTVENLKQREKYLTKELFQSLLSTERDKDYFTASDRAPKAFRVAACKSTGEDKAELGVHLFWKDDTTTVQKEVKVEAVKSDDKWLINKVSSE